MIANDILLFVIFYESKGKKKERYYLYPVQSVLKCSVIRNALTFSS